MFTRNVSLVLLLLPTYLGATQSWLYSQFDKGTKTDGVAAPATPLVDPAIVGSWSSTTAAEKGGATISFGVRSDGAYAWVCIGPGRPLNRGRIHAFNGRWTLVAENIRFEDAGTYRFPTDNTLELVGRNDKFLFSLDQGSGVVATRKSAVEPEREVVVNQPSKILVPTAGQGVIGATSRDATGFTVEETFLATNMKADMLTYGGQPVGVAVRTGGEADYVDDTMTSEKRHAKVQFNGSFGPNYQVIGEVVVSPDGRHHGYFAMKQDRWFLVVNGSAIPIGPQKDTTDVYLNSAEIVFSEDGTRWSAVAGFLYELGESVWEEHQVLVDGKDAAPNMAWVVKQGDEFKSGLFGSGFSNPRFSPNGKKFAYIRTAPSEVASKRTTRKQDGETTNQYRFSPGKARRFSCLRPECGDLYIVPSFVTLTFPALVGLSPVPIPNTVGQSLAHSAANSRNRLGRTRV